MSKPTPEHIYLDTRIVADELGSVLELYDPETGKGVMNVTMIEMSSSHDDFAIVRAEFILYGPSRKTKVSKEELADALAKLKRRTS